MYSGDEGQIPSHGSTNHIQLKPRLVAPNNMKVNDYKLRIDLLGPGYPPISISVITDLSESIALSYADVPKPSFKVYYHNCELFTGCIDYTQNLAYLDQVKRPPDNVIHGIDKLTFLDIVLKYKAALPDLKQEVLDQVAVLKNKYDAYKYMDALKI